MEHTNGTNGLETPRVHASTKLRQMLNTTNDIIVAPGVYDGFSARIALEVGFDCIYMVSPETNRTATFTDTYRPVLVPSRPGSASQISASRLCPICKPTQT